MYFDDLKIGMSADIEPVVIDKEKMLDFARKYDNIPLHVDEEYAKSTHFGGLIAPGVFSFLEVWEKYLEADDFICDQLLAGRSTKIEWFKPVYAGDVLKGRAEITNLTVRSEKNGLVELTAKVYNQSGDLVLTGVTEAVVKRDLSKKRRLKQ